MKRVERRYLIKSYGVLVKALHEHGMKYKTYTVHTAYLDHNPPTWSADKGSKKYRIRWYNNDPSEMYFETKSRKGDIVIKRRRKLKSEKWYGLKTVAAVEYIRHEYVGVEGWLRVTIDVGVISPNCKDVLDTVVEVKSKKILDTKWLEDLLPPQQEGFSKSKWALGRWTAK